MGFEFFFHHRIKIMAIVTMIALLSVLLLPKIQFNFSFEQFFPEGDEDLQYFQEFISEFETDDNFLLIAIENHSSVFDSTYLAKIASFTRDCKKLDYIQSVQSLADFRYPIKIPFGYSSIAAVHPNDPIQLRKDSSRLLNDERVIYRLINKKANSSCVVIKTLDGMGIDQSTIFISQIEKLLNKHTFEKYHLLGRSYFQNELSDMQFREILRSTIVSTILITIIMIFIYRRAATVFIVLSSIGVGLLIFLGLLSLLGRELSLMAALYPVLMLIVGTSDVVHIMTKYFDELKKGIIMKEALRKTIYQIGLATLMTSLTTAIGFATLMSSRIEPIRAFGLNSAIGVIIAYIVVIGFTCPLLTIFSKSQMISSNNSDHRWSNFIKKAYNSTLGKQTFVLSGFFVFIVFAAIGISLMHTNYAIETNLPNGEKVTEDFKYFEAEYAGFRPLEFAGIIQEDRDIYDYKVVKSIYDLENYIKSKEAIQTAFSLATVIKSINQMNHANKQEAYVFPDSIEYKKIRSQIQKVNISGLDLLVNKNKDKTRISARLKDLGSDNIKSLQDTIDEWMSVNLDPNVIQFEATGTGLILDKNSEFVKDSLLSGLAIALLMVSVLMGFLFRNIKVLLLALIPNIIPLLFAAALLGYFDIAVEAGISIVFAIIFGIAVDDTIHFLSKYKMAMDELKDREKALQVTFNEAGKAIIITSIILFFGFLVLLFSIHPPSVTIGALISATLLSAVIADLTLLPVLIRKFKM